MEYFFLSFYKIIKYCVDFFYNLVVIPDINLSYLDFMVFFGLLTVITTLLIGRIGKEK